MSDQDLQPLESRVPVATGEVVPQVAKRLYRSRRERVIFGVCGGIAQHFKVDPVLVRALWVLLSLMTAVIPGMILYVIATVIIPENSGEEESAPGRRLHVENNVLWGGLLIVAGIFFLLRALGRYTHRYLPDLAYYWDVVWGTVRGLALPAVVIGIGLLLIFGVTRRGQVESGKRLTRSRQDRMIAGVCGGLGQYLKIDSTWVRLAFVLLTVFTKGIGLILYLVAVLAVPEESPAASEN